MKCSVKRDLSSVTCRTSLVVGRRDVGPLPTGYSPVAACFMQQIIISIRLDSWRSSRAEKQETSFRSCASHKVQTNQHSSNTNKCFNASDKTNQVVIFLAGKFGSIFHISSFYYTAQVCCLLNFCSNSICRPQMMNTCSSGRLQIGRNLFTFWHIFF